MKNAALIKVLREKGIRHPDFHAGNIMYCPESAEMALIDVYGIKAEACGRKLSKKDENRLLHLLVEYSGRLSEEDVFRLFEACGLNLSGKEILLRWQELLAANERHIFHEWPKRRRQILSGHSKFCRLASPEDVQVELGGHQKLMIRNTPYFTVQNPDLSKLGIVKLSHEAAENLWLESFRKQLLHREEEKRLPQAWLQRDDGTDLLYF